MLKNKLLAELKLDLAPRHVLCEKELSAGNVQQKKLFARKYAESIISNTHACFQENMLPVLGLFSIFNVENIPSSSHSQEFKIYGNESIRILKDHY